MQFRVAQTYTRSHPTVWRGTVFAFDNDDVERQQGDSARSVMEHGSMGKEGVNDSIDGRPVGPGRECPWADLHLAKSRLQVHGFLSLCF